MPTKVHTSLRASALINSPKPFTASKRMAVALPQRVPRHRPSAAVAQASPTIARRAIAGQPIAAKSARAEGFRGPQPVHFVVPGLQREDGGETDDGARREEKAQRHNTPGPSIQRRKPSCHLSW